MNQPETPTPDRLTSDPSSSGAWWNNLNPGLRAAIVVGGVIILLEIVSEFVPLIGYIVTIPVAIVTYYIQGILAGWFLKRDPRFRDPLASQYLRAGIISAFWTSVVISTAVALIDGVLLTSFTLGVFLTTIPLLLASSLVDIILNLFFTSLGAWLYSRFSLRGLVGVSCGVLAVTLAGLCLVAGISIFSGIGLLRHLGLTLPKIMT